MVSQNDPLCPSGRCSAGSVLLGIMGPLGQLVYTPRAQILDKELADRFEAAGGSARYRFAEPCVTHDCRHWSDLGCAIGAAGAAIGAGQENAELPHCAIRSACRWFEQEGRNACLACPGVLRDDPMAGQFHG